MTGEKQKLSHVNKIKVCPEETANITSNSVFFLQTQNSPTTSIKSSCHLSAAKNMCAHAQTPACAHTCMHTMHSTDPKFSQE